MNQSFDEKMREKLAGVQPEDVGRSPSWDQIWRRVEGKQRRLHALRPRRHIWTHAAALAAGIVLATLFFGWPTSYDPPIAVRQEPASTQHETPTVEAAATRHDNSLPDTKERHETRSVRRVGPASPTLEPATPAARTAALPEGLAIVGIDENTDKDNDGGLSEALRLPDTREREELPVVHLYDLNLGTPAERVAPRRSPFLARHESTGTHRGDDTTGAPLLSLLNTFK